MRLRSSDLLRLRGGVILGPGMRRTEPGDQFVIPGVAPVTDKDRAEAKGRVNCRLRLTFERLRPLSWPGDPHYPRQPTPLGEARQDRF